MDEFEWDDLKATNNVQKHGVRFEVVHDFDWDDATFTVDDRRDYGELRVKAIGRDPIGDFYSVIFTMRVVRRRIISARKANRREIEKWQQEHVM